MTADSVQVERQTEPVPLVPPVLVDTWGLYLGSLQSVAQPVLQQHNIRYVVSCMLNTPPDLQALGASGQIELLTVPIEDRAHANIKEHFERTHRFIERARGRGDGGCLVHCLWGQSRSVAVVLAHLLQRTRGPLLSALRHCLDRHPATCRPNPGFMAQLVQLELEAAGAASDLRPLRKQYGASLVPNSWLALYWTQGHVMRCTPVPMPPKPAFAPTRVARLECFVTRDEARHIINLARPNLHPSRVVDAAAKRDPGVHNSGGRTSWSCKIPVADPVARAMVQRACLLSGLTPLHAEAVQVVRYRPGQEYKAHHDYFQRGPNYAANAAENRGGQRAVTVFCILQAPGDTVCPPADCQDATGEENGDENPARAGEEPVPGAIAESERTGTPSVATGEDAAAVVGKEVLSTRQHVNEGGRMSLRNVQEDGAGEGDREECESTSAIGSHGDAQHLEQRRPFGEGPSGVEVFVEDASGRTRAPGTGHPLVCDQHRKPDAGKALPQSAEFGGKAYGGQTDFPTLDMSFEPVSGNALLWWNVTPDGVEDSNTLHCGAKVHKGEKWGLNLWLRRGPRAQDLKD